MQGAGKETLVFRDAPLHEVDPPFLMMDVTYLEVRENHKILFKAFMVALVVKGDGRREVLGSHVHGPEGKCSWAVFLGNLNGRGLKNVQMGISYIHKAITASLQKPIRRQYGKGAKYIFFGTSSMRPRQNTKED